MKRFLVVALIGCSSSNFEVASGDAATPTDSSIDETSVVSETSPSDAIVPDGGSALAETCRKGAEVACARFEACVPFIVELTYRDHADCVARNAYICLRNIEAPGHGRTVELQEACIAKYGALTCGELIAGRFPAECAKVLGELAPGAECRDHAQCMTGFCIGNGPNLCGRCSANKSDPGTPCESGQCRLGLASV
jgi:hypothetical protein